MGGGGPANNTRDFLFLDIDPVVLALSLKAEDDGGGEVRCWKAG